MPHDPHLADMLRGALDGRPGVTEQAMFGGYCWMLNGNMLCGVGVGRFMFRVGKDLMAEELERPGAEQASMGGRRMGGRRMGGIVWVEADACLATGLDDWIDFAAQFAGSLPPK